MQTKPFRWTVKSLMTFTAGITVEAFDGFENLFRYHLEDEAYSAFRVEFVRKKKIYFWTLDSLLVAHLRISPTHP